MRKLSLTSLFCTIGVITAQTPCTLQCPADIGSTCVVDPAPLGTHCKCPGFFTGLKCEVRYEACGDGEHICYHGGTCESGLVDEFGNNQYYCNCDAAVDVTGTKHVGKYCEHPIVSATACTTQNQNEFCFNGGVCNPQYP